MPRRRRYRTLTIRDLRNLENIAPTSWMILAAILIGGIVFVIGIWLIISSISWLGSNFELPNGFTFDLSIFAILSLVVLTFALIIGLSIVLIAKYNREIEKKYRGLQIANIDYMTGIEFEQYLKRVLASQGYNVSTTRVSGDLGVDLVALGHGDRIAIQAKCYHNKVPRNAISDAVAGMSYYGCNKAMVITNNYFSPGAIALAQSNGCLLVDRDILAKWINDYRNTDTQITQPSKRVQ